MIALPILASDRKRPAKCVETEERIGARQEGDLGYNAARNQIPADNIAKRLVEANTVKVDRDTLRCSEKGRGCISSVVEIGLKWIALNLVETDTPKSSIEQI